MIPIKIEPDTNFGKFALKVWINDPKFGPKWETLHVDCLPNLVKMQKTLELLQV